MKLGMMRWKRLLTNPVPWVVAWQSCLKFSAVFGATADQLMPKGQEGSRDIRCISYALMEDRMSEDGRGKARRQKTVAFVTEWTTCHDGWEGAKG
jgi:hypothetical protein